VLAGLGWCVLVGNRMREGGCVLSGLRGDLVVRPEARTSPPRDDVGATDLAPLLYRGDVTLNTSSELSLVYVEGHWQLAPQPLCRCLASHPWTLLAQGYLGYKHTRVTRTGVPRS